MRFHYHSQHSPIWRAAIIAFLAQIVGLGAPVLHAADGKTFIDYFLPTKISGTLSSQVWGAAAVGARDADNGLEDSAMTQWNYWDGQIIKGPDGTFHLFASRWEQSKGHAGWVTSKAIHSVSHVLTGPYVDKGLCWPTNQDGKGHNVTALALPDGRFAIITSDTRPGDVFIAKSLDGPWEFQGPIKIDDSHFAFGLTKNLCVMVRPDGAFQMVPESGIIAISTTGIMGPYVVKGASVYPSTAGLPLDTLEDQVAWFSGGFYHIVVNSWNTRKAYHLISRNGIDGWIFKGLAYDPTRDFVRYSNGTINHWHKLERPGVYIENGHVKALTLAALDVPKEQQQGNDTHGSKILVIPFDGIGLDRDLQSEFHPAPAPAAK